MAEKRPDQMDALVSAIAELARPPDPEVLRLMAEHRKLPRDPNRSELGQGPMARPEA